MKTGRSHSPIRPEPTLRSLLAAALLALLAIGCGQPADDTETAETPAPIAETPADESEAAVEDGGAKLYSVRGEVIENHGDRTPRGLVLHHEAIDDFESITGDVWGMDSMTMPFLVSDDVTLDDLAEGDKIAFTLRVDWSDDDTPQIVTGLEKLPADTELEFRTARPPAPADETLPADPEDR